MPSIVTPAIAGLVFAGWSRLAPEPPEKHFRASVNEPLWLPSARGAFAFLVSVLIVAMSPILFDVFAYAEHPWRMIPFEVVNAVVGPAFFVSVFVIGSPRALLVAFAASAIVYMVVQLQHAIDDVVCAKIDGESTSCAVQNLWFAAHQSLPAMLTIAAAALLGFALVPPRPRPKAGRRTGHVAFRKFLKPRRVPHHEAARALAAALPA